MRIFQGPKQPCEKFQLKQSFNTSSSSICFKNHTREKRAFLWLFVPIYFPALAAKYATETNFIYPYGYCSSTDMQIPAFIHARFEVY